MKRLLPVLLSALLMLIMVFMVSGQVLAGFEIYHNEPKSRSEETDTMFEGFTDFYYTYETSTAVSYYQRYRFYSEDGKYFFYHETREGGSWPQTEEDITKSGTTELSKEDMQTFFSLLEGGKIKQPDDDVIDGDFGPWTYIYRGNGQEEYIFESYDARLEFEEYCEGLSRSDHQHVKNNSSGKK